MSTALEPLGTALGRMARQMPAQPAITCDGITRNWAELDRISNRLAHGLASLGTRQGDMVTVGLPNSVSFVEVCWACWKLGATPQPVSWRLPTAELDAIVDLAAPAAVIGPAGLSCRQPVITAEELWQLTQDERPLPEAVAPSWKAPTSGGSTGRPKLIVAGQAGVLDPAIPELWRLQADDTALIPGPLYHNGPFVTTFATMMAGGHAVVAPRFSPEGVLADIQRHRATWLYLVPTMMSRIWHLGPEVRESHDLRSLRTVWHLAAPCPPWLKEAWIDWLGAEVIWELYGGTEGQAVTTIDGHDWLRHRGSVGRVVAGEIRVLDADGHDLPAGEVGEVYMRRGADAEPTYRYIGAQARSRDQGWESLGDLGWFDAEGFLYLSDRRTDMILVGGANVYPAEVEGALEAYDQVRSCAVIGLPDPDLGSRIHAIIQPGPEFDLGALETHVAQTLVRYKRPHSYELVSTPLRDDAGKVRRSRLRAERAP